MAYRERHDSSKLQMHLLQKLVRAYNQMSSIHLRLSSNGRTRQTNTALRNIQTQLRNCICTFGKDHSRRNEPHVESYGHCDQCNDHLKYEERFAYHRILKNSLTNINDVGFTTQLQITIHC